MAVFGKDGKSSGEGIQPAAASTGRLPPLGDRHQKSIVTGDRLQPLFQAWVTGEGAPDFAPNERPRQPFGQAPSARYDHGQRPPEGFSSNVGAGAGEGPRYFQGGADGPEWEPVEIEAEVIRRVIDGDLEDASGTGLQVSSRGLFLPPGSTVIGNLDLTAATFDKPITLTKCTLEHVVFNYATLGPLDLQGSTMKWLFGSGARINGPLMLSYIEAETVDLINADIRGQVTVRGSTLGSEQGREAGVPALNAQGVRIGLDLFLDKPNFKDGKFLAIGEVILDGATIGGQLSCIGGHFKNPGGTALNANAVVINDTVLLNSGFETEGRVSLIGTRVEGDLECIASRVSSPEDVAFDGRGLIVGGQMSLRDGYRSEGATRLDSAAIDGILDCSGATFLAPERVALNLSNTRLGNDLYLREARYFKEPMAFLAEGEVRLSNARVAGSIDCSGAQMINPKGWALGGETIEVGADLYLFRGFKSEGVLSLRRGKVAGNVQFSGASLNGAERTEALDATSLTVGNTFDFSGLQAVVGKVTLLDAEIHLLADDGSGWPSEGTLTLDGLVYNRFTNSDRSETGTTKLSARERIRWLCLQEPKCLGAEFRPQPWTQLASVLKRMGHDKDAREVLIARERQRLSPANKNVRGFERVWRGLLLAPMGHGYKPQNAVWIALVVLLAGWVIFGLAGANGLMRPASDEVLVSEAYQAGELPPDYMPFHAGLYTLDVFLPIIDFGQERSWIPRDSADDPLRLDKVKVSWPEQLLGEAITLPAWLPKTAWALTIALGWLLTTIFVTAASGLLRRE